ncbi:MAG: murein biosynthesis integral membrane protein MurJ [Marinosulfonomonas sp.]
MNVFRVSFALTIIALISRVLGLGRDLAVTWSFGANAVTDSFYIAASFAYASYIIIGASLTSASIPFLSGKKIGNNSENAFRSISNLLNLVLLSLIVAAVFGILYADSISGIISQTEDIESRRNTTLFIMLLLPAIVGLGAAGLLTGILNHYHVFLPAAAAPALLNLSVIVCTFTFRTGFGIYSSIAGVLVGSLLFIGVQIPILYRVKYKHSWSIRLSDPNLFALIAATMPILAVAFLTFGYTFIDNFVGSMLDEGTVTAVNIATKLIQLPQGLIAMGLSIATYPKISELLAKNEIPEASQLLSKVSKIILFLAMPATIGLAVTSDLLVSSVFQKGPFSDAAADATSNIFGIMVIALPGFSLNVFLLRIFYAMKRWKGPVATYLIGFTIKLFLSLYLVDALGSSALSFSTVFAVYINSLLLLWLINKNMDSPFNLAFFLVILRVFLATAVMGFVLIMVDYFSMLAPFGFGGWAELLVKILLGASIYFVVCILFLKRELNDLKGLISREF